MARFLAGFAAASALWGVAAFLYVGGFLSSAEDAPPQLAELGAPDAGAAQIDAPRRRRRGRRGGRPDAHGAAPRGQATTGDALGEDDPRSLDVGAGGGEEQLTQAEIQQAMDAVFGRVRRCLVLAAGDEPVSGRLVFGLRIEPSGTASRVSLSGPAAVTTGDAGECLRGAARGARFPTFDGAPMIVRYPVTLE